MSRGFDSHHYRQAVNRVAEGARSYRVCCGFESHHCYQERQSDGWRRNFPATEASLKGPCGFDPHPLRQDRQADWRRQHVGSVSRCNNPWGFDSPSIRQQPQDDPAQGRGADMDLGFGRRPSV